MAESPPQTSPALAPPELKTETAPRARRVTPQSDKSGRLKQTKRTQEMETTEMFEILRDDIRGVHTRFDRFEERVDERFRESEEKFDARLLQSEERVDARLLQNEERVERRITEVKADLGQRISDVQTNLGQQIKDVQTNLGQRISDVDQRVTDVRTDLMDRLDAVNDRIDEVRVDIREAFSRRLQAWTVAVGSATALAVACSFVLQLYVVLE